MMTQSETRQMAAHLLQGAAGRIISSAGGYTRDPKRRDTAQVLCDPEVNGVVASRALDRLTERLETGDAYASQLYTDLTGKYGCAERNVIRFAAMNDKSRAKLDELAASNTGGEGFTLGRRARSSDSVYAHLTPEMFEVMNASWDGRELIKRRSVSTYPSSGTRAELKTFVGRLAGRELTRAAEEVRAERGVAKNVELSLDAAPTFEGAEEGRAAFEAWDRGLYADSLTHSTVANASKSNESVAKAMGDDRFADEVEAYLRGDITSRLQELHEAGEKGSVVRKEAYQMLDGIMSDTGAAETLESEARERRVDSARSAALDKVLEYAHEAAGTGDYERFLSEMRAVLLGDAGGDTKRAETSKALTDFVCARVGSEPAAEVHEVETTREADADLGMER